MFQRQDINDCSELRAFIETNFEQVKEEFNYHQAKEKLIEYTYILEEFFRFLKNKDK